MHTRNIYAQTHTLTHIFSHRDWTGPPMAVLLNKTDLIGEEDIAELADWYKENCRADEVRGRTVWGAGN